MCAILLAVAASTKIEAMQKRVDEALASGVSDKSPADIRATALAQAQAEHGR